MLFKRTAALQPLNHMESDSDGVGEEEPAQGSDAESVDDSWFDQLVSTALSREGSSLGDMDEPDEALPVECQIEEQEWLEMLETQLDPNTQPEEFLDPKPSSEPRPVARPLQSSSGLAAASKPVCDDDSDVLVIEDDTVHRPGVESKPSKAERARILREKINALQKLIGDTEYITCFGYSMF